jgi:hypothetical protein
MSNIYVKLAVPIIAVSSWSTLGAYRGHKHYMSLPMTKDTNYSILRDFAWCYTGVIVYSGIVTTPFVMMKEIQRLLDKDLNNYKYNELI